MIVKIMLKMFAMNENFPINPLILITLLVVNLLYFISVTTMVLPINNLIFFCYVANAIYFYQYNFKVIKVYLKRECKPRYDLGNGKLYFILKFQTFQPLNSTV